MAQRSDYHGPLTDSRRWDHITLRPDDMIIVTPPKSGTTWMQTIVALLISGDPDVDPELSVKMPWIDIRFRPIAEIADRLDAMPNRRCMKSHTPMDGCPWTIRPSTSVCFAILWMRIFPFETTCATCPCHCWTIGTLTTTPTT